MTSVSVPMAGMSAGGSSHGCSPTVEKQDEEEQRAADRRLVKRCEASSPYSNLFLLGKCAGLCFYIPARKRCGIYISWTLVYHGALLLLSWFTVLRFFFAYEKGEVFGPSLVRKAVHHTFFLKVSLCVTSSTFLSLRRDRLWKSYNKHNEAFGFDLRHNPSVRRRVTIATMACCLTCLGVFAFYVHSSVVKTDTWVETLGFNMVKSSRVRSILLGLTCLQAILISAAWILPISLLALLCLDLADAFKKLTTDLEKKVSSAASLDLEHFRRRHQGLCGIVQQMDDIYTYLILSVYLTSVPLICLLIYVVLMASEADSREMVTENVLVFVCCLTDMVTVTTVATVLNTAALSCKPVLYSICLNESSYSNEKILQFLAFLSVLTEGNIGLTGWKLFCVNKKTVKTVFLMIVTYTVILLKFGNQELNTGPPHDSRLLHATPASTANLMDSYGTRTATDR